MGWDAYAATMARRGAANAEAIVVFTFEITFAVIDAYEIYENAYCLGLRRVRGPSIDPLQPHGRTSTKWRLFGSRAPGPPALPTIK